MSLKFIDLFAGLGGFHVALRSLGHECVMASESDPVLQETYENNFGIRPRGDIRAIPTSSIPRHDVLCAGFPCQPFSKAGTQLGFACPRFGDLFSEIVRVLTARRPRYFILENVGNLRAHDNGNTWRSILGTLRGLGYTVDAATLSPQDLGVPQGRDRIFIAGVHAGMPSVTWPGKVKSQLTISGFLDSDPPEAMPLSSKKIEALEVWQEFLDQFPAGKELPTFPIWSAEFGADYPYISSTPWSLGERSLFMYRGSHGQSLAGLEGDDLWNALPAYARRKENVFPRWKERFIEQNRRLYQQNRSWIDRWLPRLGGLPPSLQKLEWNCKGGERRIWSYLVQFRASGVRVRDPRTSPTLVAMNTTQVPVVAWQRRYMTPRECARIQGLQGLRHLPSKNDAAFRALGNAVNADVVAEIAAGLLSSEPLPSSHRTARPQGSTRIMPTALQDDRINIRPPVNVLSVLRHLNYQPWYALAEFVDNALQSYLSNRAELKRVDGRNAVLKIDITIDPTDEGRIVVRDNAGGIAKKDYARAFRAAEVPPDRSGLSEFGMGMKSAACWFAPQWTVRTKALGESVERKVTFDINTIVRDSLEELEIKSTKTKADAHYTEILLTQVYKTPQRRTLGKIRDHLAGMYRIFLREGTLVLTLNGEALEHELPQTMTAPFYKTPSARPQEWRKEIEIELSGGRSVKGFAALRDKGSTIDSGFALFRRKRAITGTADQGYRPEIIFGRSNSYVYQRLFGELHLTGFPVSHTKDGFRWDESEEELLHALKKVLDAKPLPLLQQAMGHRSKPSKKEMQRAAKKVVDDTAETIKNNAPDTLETLDALDEEAPREQFRKVNKQDTIRRTIEIERHGAKWEIVIEACYDEAMTDWIEVIAQNPKRGTKRVGVRLALCHPFTERFGGSNSGDLEPLMRIAAALGLAETTAREIGVKRAGTIRVHFNELMRDTMAVG